VVGQVVLVDVLVNVVDEMILFAVVPNILMHAIDVVLILDFAGVLLYQVLELLLGILLKANKTKRNVIGRVTVQETLKNNQQQQKSFDKEFIKFYNNFIHPIHSNSFIFKSRNKINKTFYHGLYLEDYRFCHFLIFHQILSPTK